MLSRSATRLDAGGNEDLLMLERAEAERYRQFMRALDARKNTARAPPNPPPQQPQHHNAFPSPQQQQQHYGAPPAQHSSMYAEQHVGCYNAAASVSMPQTSTPFAPPPATAAATASSVQRRGGAAAAILRSPTGPFPPTHAATAAAAGAYANASAPQPADEG